jgi:cytidyltransferase-like protein
MGLGTDQSLEIELSRFQQNLRLFESDIRIGLCHGCFDLLHIGHIQHLREAKSRVDVLVVTVTPDSLVNKGDWRPVFTAQHRAECLAALRHVDRVFINEWPTAERTIELLKPNFYFKGPECRQHQSAGLLAEIKAAKGVNAEIAYTAEAIFSSTELVRKVVAFYA